ncbi:MAG: biliverdin-producing heme oxygenase [Acidimicrobiales bacterium]|nr:biliverdin-producing heme oxygenase [Acidimicrobiales bacterium]HRW36173.1 biliverdin-producing heme oxygenase [Aquihabitans sp.]
MPTDTHADAPSLSALVRSRTTTDHRSAERSGFPSALVRGEVALEGYVDLLAQHRYAYEVLEEVRDRHLSDPDVGPFLDARLLRSQALADDLVDLAGPTWSVAHPPSAATVAYVEAIAATAVDPVAHLAHHYTRYLGDLSGGQFIGRVAASTYGLGDGRAGRFATFAGIDDPAAYRDEYRARLDALDWPVDRQEALVAAVHEAYRHNEAVFDDLARHVD